MSGRARSIASRAGAFVRPCALAFAVVLVLTLAVPEPAHAFDPLGIGDKLQGWVEDAINFFLELLFGKDLAEMTGETLRWLVDLPDFAESDVQSLRRTLDTMAFALLALAMTASILRFWLAGLTDSGSSTPMDGFVRCIGAALAIVLWPWVFDSVMLVGDSASHALLSDPQTLDRASTLISSAVTVGAIGGSIVPIIGIIITVTGAVLLLGLFIMKIVLVCGLAAVYVLMPPAIVLGQIPGYDWLASSVTRVFAVLTLWPFIWAVFFRCFISLSSDVVNYEGDDGFITQAIVQPLSAIAMLFLCIKVPSMMTKYAMIGLPSGGGRGILRTATTVAAVAGGRQAAGALLGGVGGGGRGAPTGGTPNRGQQRPGGGNQRGQQQQRPGQQQNQQRNGGQQPPGGQRPPNGQQPPGGGPNGGGPNGGGPNGGGQNGAGRMTAAMAKRMAESVPDNVRPNADMVRGAMERLGSQEAARMASAHAGGTLRWEASQAAAHAHNSGDGDAARQYFTLAAASLNSASAGIADYQSRVNQGTTSPPPPPPPPPNNGGNGGNGGGPRATPGPNATPGPRTP